MRAGTDHDYDERSADLVDFEHSYQSVEAKKTAQKSSRKARPVVVKANKLVDEMVSDFYCCV